MDLENGEAACSRAERAALALEMDETQVLALMTAAAKDGRRSATGGGASAAPSVRGGMGVRVLVKNGKQVAYKVQLEGQTRVVKVRPAEGQRHVLRRGKESVSMPRATLANYRPVVDAAMAKTVQNAKGLMEEWRRADSAATASADAATEVKESNTNAAQAAANSPKGHNHVDRGSVLQKEDSANVSEQTVVRNRKVPDSNIDVSRQKGGDSTRKPTRTTPSHAPASQKHRALADTDAKLETAQGTPEKGNISHSNRGRQRERVQPQAPLPPPLQSPERTLNHTLRQGTQHSVAQLPPLALPQGLYASEINTLRDMVEHFQERYRAYFVMFSELDAVWFAHRQAVVEPGPRQDRWNARVERYMTVHNEVARLRWEIFKKCVELETRAQKEGMSGEELWERALW